MRLVQLSDLNQRRAAREAVALVTDLTTDETFLLSPREAASHGLKDALEEAFRTGKSGVIENENGRYFINVHVPPVKIVITGAVHISQAFAEMARILGLDCTIIDPRTAFATPERFPASSLLAEWPEAVLPGLGVDRFTAFVALTHDPKIDDPGLIHALQRGCFYIGALGSRKTHAKRLERLARQGFSQEQLDRIHAPIGLDIGAVSPAEIALSILGEIIATMRAKRRV